MHWQLTFKRAFWGIPQGRLRANAPIHKSVENGFTILCVKPLCHMDAITAVIARTCSDPCDSAWSMHCGYALAKYGALLFAYGGGIRRGGTRAISLQYSTDYALISGREIWRWTSNRCSAFFVLRCYTESRWDVYGYGIWPSLCVCKIQFSSISRKSHQLNKVRLFFLFTSRTIYLYPIAYTSVRINCNVLLGVVGIHQKSGIQWKLKKPMKAMAWEVVDMTKIDHSRHSLQFWQVNSKEAEENSDVLNEDTAGEGTSYREVRHIPPHLARVTTRRYWMMDTIQ